jgi:uncharacterized protein (TIGR02246 family)
MTVAEVGAIAQAFHEGVANRDAAALADLYREDGRFLPPNMEPAEGKAAIQASMQQLLDMGASSLEHARRATSPSNTAATRSASSFQTGRP